MVLRLPDTPEIKKIESRFINLIERTFLKGAIGKPGPRIQAGVKREFNSKTFILQLDKIIDDIFKASVAYADKQVKRPPSFYKRTAAGDSFKGPYPITEELIKQSGKLSAEVSESLIRFLKDDNLYTLHPNQLEKHIRDLWGGDKKRAVRFARTITADIAVNTAVTRYEDMGITALQFYAKLDDRTTPQCRTLHGTVFQVSKKGDLAQYRPPLHMHCRSDLLPVPVNYKVDDNLRMEYRDFSKHYDSNFNIIEGIDIPAESIQKTFEAIDTFNEKYRISQFILDEDTERRLMKLNLTITGLPPKSIPKHKSEPKPKPEPAKVKEKKPKVKKTPEPVKEPAKPQYRTPAEIRKDIPKAKVEHENKIQQISNEINRISAERDQIWEEYEYHRDSMNLKTYKKNSPEFAKDDKKLRDLYDAYEKESEKFSKKMAERSELMLNEKEAIRKLIYINDGTPRTKLLNVDKKGPKISIGDAEQAKLIRKQQAQETLDFFNRAVSEKLRNNMPDIKVVEHKLGFRPNADITNGKINMAPDYGTKTLIHEAGHHLEWKNQELYQSAERMIQRRTKGEGLRKMRDVTGSNFYRNDEVTRPDRFFSPYVGKTYGDNVGYSEAVSTSLAELYADPEGLATKDPETFDWIINAIRGIYD
jgi:SPP1 gp7 family putative phage head morphogenesis protein